MNSTKPHLLSYFRRSILRKLWQPVLFFAASFLIFHITNTDQLLFPAEFSESYQVSAFARNHSYATLTAHDLYYTGYDYSVNNQLKGHFYYTLSDNRMQIYLLQAHMGRDAVPYYPEQTFTVLIEENDSMIAMVVLSMAGNLGWTAEALNSITGSYLLNQYACHKVQTLCSAGFGVFFLLAGAILLLRDILLLCFPKLSPGFMALARHGKLDRILPEVDQQLQNNCLIRTSDMALTPKYLVEFSGSTSAIVPMESVLWAFLSENYQHCRMVYNLHLVLETGERYSFRKKPKDELDIIMAQLTEHFPNFFIGYSEEHRELVSHILKDHRENQFSKLLRKISKK